MGAILFFALCLLMSPAHAAQSPRDFYVRGDWAAAIAAAEAAPSGENLALAARAAIAEANLRDTPCLECLEHAEDLAARAIAADPRRAESYVLLAVALGFEARIIGKVRAEFGGHARRAKRALETALSLDATAAQTLAAFGAWHIEVVRMGGALGTALYGARFAAGRDLYRRGVAGDPANLVLRLNYALSLSGYGFDTYRAEIAVQLASAANGVARNAYETALKARAVLLRDLLAQNKRAEFLALVSRYQGYP